MKTWTDRVRSVYTDLEELIRYDQVYGVVARCGYDSAEDLWQTNPVIGGSCRPEDFGLATSSDIERTKL